MNYTGFIFPAFEYNSFKDLTSFKGVQIYWKLFHNVFKANFTQVIASKTFQLLSRFFMNLHQQLLLVIFLRKKMRQSCKIIQKFSFQTTFGPRGKKDGGKPEFCRHIQIGLKIGVMRRSHHLNNSLSLWTFKALTRTLRCQANLIENLFDDDYDFILTAHFQSNPLEWCFSRCRGMSGGFFLISVEDTICSEKNLKIKSLLREDTDINEEIKIICLGVNGNHGTKNRLMRLMRLTIQIFATKGLPTFSISTISIFSVSKSPKPKSNCNFHFSYLLSGELISIHEKHWKFKSSFYWRYLESPKFFLIRLF